jgi:signal transduction histidine kinase
LNSAKRGDLLKLGLAIGWLIFSVTFAIWWFKFSLDHISTLAELDPSHLEHWMRQKRMVFSEGTAWIILLAVGGGALIVFVQNERLRVRRIREFFASFSHEVKTSLASLRLQAEALKDELGDDHSSPILGRLIGDTVRLQVQLENSLFFASQGDLQLFLEPVRLAPIIERMREQWPNLKIDLNQDVRVRADERAMRSILGNLVQNAFVHGKAHEIQIEVKESGPDVLISVQDDGQGFDGNPRTLGELFFRPKKTSGSGLGLYICKLLTQRMEGQIDFVPSKRGFRSELRLRKASA